MMRFALMLALSMATAPAAAGCLSDAQEQKLEGAALKAFLMKCRMEAMTACDADAKSKNLSGTEKTTHVNKCLAVAVGN